MFGIEQSALLLGWFLHRGKVQETVLDALQLSPESTIHHGCILRRVSSRSRHIPRLIEWMRLSPAWSYKIHCQRIPREDLTWDH